MREATVYVVSGVALLGGLFLACMMRPQSASSVTQYDTLALRRGPATQGESRSTPRAAVTKVTLPAAPPEPVEASSTPEAVHAWRRKDKDEIEQRVARLSAGDAENLCFNLRLIPRDEVFDKVNVKGRLTRYIDGLRTPAELADVEAAFREVEAHH